MVIVLLFVCLETSVSYHVKGLSESEKLGETYEFVD